MFLCSAHRLTFSLVEGRPLHSVKCKLRLKHEHSFCVSLMAVGTNGKKHELRMLISSANHCFVQWQSNRLQNFYKKVSLKLYIDLSVPSIQSSGLPVSLQTLRCTGISSCGAHTVKNQNTYKNYLQKCKTNPICSCTRLFVNNEHDSTASATHRLNIIAPRHIRKGNSGRAQARRWLMLNDLQACMCQAKISDA